MPWKSMQRVSTIFDDKTFERIRKYAKDKKLSMYALAKKSILEFIERHP